MDNRMDRSRIEEIRQRVEKATKGLWEANGMDITGVWRVKYPGAVYPAFVLGCYKGINDAEFVAHARQDIPYLLSLLAKQDAAQEVVECANDLNELDMGLDYEVPAVRMERLIKALAAYDQINKEPKNA